MPQRAIMVIGSFYIKCVTDCGAASAADILILPIVMVEKESENILTGDNKRRTDRQTDTVFLLRNNSRSDNRSFRCKGE